MNRQRLILFVLVILFAVAALWSYRAMPRYKTVSSLSNVPAQKPQTPAPEERTPARAATDGRILNLALLEQDQAEFRGYRRNIFKPLFVDEQKLARQKATAIKPPQLPPVQPPKAAPVEPAAPARPEAAALARFTFLGFLTKDGQRTIFLAKDKDVILVKKGDKVAGRYEAVSITDQALTLLVTDTGGEIVIPLIENRPLAANK